MSLSPHLRRLAVHGGIMIAAALTLATAGAQSAGAAARPAALAAPAMNPYSPAYHHAYRHGVVPTLAAGARMRAWAAAHPAPADLANALSYGGGLDGTGVTTGQEKVYLVFYGSQWGTRGRDANGDLTLIGDPSGEAPYLQQLFKGLGTDNEQWSGVMTQYCQGVATGALNCPASNAQHVAYPAGGALAGVWADETKRSPATASGNQLAAEAVTAAAHFGNTTPAANRDAQYVIVSPTGTNPDNWETGGFCAWHDDNADPSLSGGPAASPYGDIAFTNLPYLTDAGGGCGQDFVNPSGTLDGVSIVAGHEYAETITDQNPSGGWTDPSSQESADKCAWIPPFASGGAFDLSLATGTFAMQTTWANDGAGGQGACEASHPIVPDGNGNVVTVTSPGNQTSTVGVKVGLQIQASDTAAGQAFTYDASGLPAGLSINPATGLITGTPIDAQTTTVNVIATDTTGATGSNSFTWSTSYGGCTAPHGHHCHRG